MNKTNIECKHKIRMKMKGLHHSFQKYKQCQFLHKYSGIKLGEISSSDKEFHVPIIIGQTVEIRLKIEI